MNKFVSFFWNNFMFIQIQIDYEEFVQMISPVINDGTKDDPFADPNQPTIPAPTIRPKK